MLYYVPVYFCVSLKPLLFLFLKQFINAVTLGSWPELCFPGISGINLLDVSSAHYGTGLLHI